MRQTLLIPIIIILFSVTVHAEVIRITFDNCIDYEPIVDCEGNVWWLRSQGGTEGDPTNPLDCAGEVNRLCFYDGTDIIPKMDFGYLDRSNIRDYKAARKIIEGRTVVYSDGNDIFLHDGNSTIKLNEDNTCGNKQPTICNGFVAWYGCVDDGGGDTEIFLYRPSSTLVTMSQIKATPSDHKVKLNWTTESEIDNEGFNVWRAEGFQKINDWMIPAAGSPTEGAEYNYLDDMVNNLRTYFYLIEDIDTEGISTFHGPVKAKPRKIYDVFE